MVIIYFLNKYEHVVGKSLFLQDRRTKASCCFFVVVVQALEQHNNSQIGEDEYISLDINHITQKKRKKNQGNNKETVLPVMIS